MVPLLSYAKTSVKLPYELDGKSGYQQNARVGLIGANDFLELFEKLAWHPEYNANINAIAGFIEKATRDKRITDWAVVWTWPNTSGQLLDIPELGGDVSL